MIKSAQTLLAKRTAGNTHDTCRSLPSSASSPMKYPFSGFGWAIAPSQKRIPRAIGRSKEGPDFLVSAGARLTVMRLDGNQKPEFLRALRTRSRLSWTAASQSQTMEKAGMPFAMSTSTSIRCQESHWIAMDPIVCIMRIKVIARYGIRICTGIA